MDEAINRYSQEFKIQPHILLLKLIGYNENETIALLIKAVRKGSPLSIKLKPGVIY